MTIMVKEQKKMKETKAIEKKKNAKFTGARTKQHTHTHTHVYINIYMRNKRDSSQKKTRESTMKTIHAFGSSPVACL